jgi:hypothetical protein
VLNFDLTTTNDKSQKSENVSIVYPPALLCMLFGSLYTSSKLTHRAHYTLDQFLRPITSSINSWQFHSPPPGGQRALYDATHSVIGASVTYPTALATNKSACMAWQRSGIFTRTYLWRLSHIAMATELRACSDRRGNTGIYGVLTKRYFKMHTHRYTVERTLAALGLRPLHNHDKCNLW